MRRTLVLLLLLSACASRDGFVDDTVRDCASGQEVSVDVYLNMPRVMMESTHDELTMVVAIGNNSNHDIEVKSIRVEPGFTAQERYALDNSFREFNELIEPGEDEQFELPVRGQAGTRAIRPRGGNDAIEVVLSVYMADGDIYRCRYNIQAPR